MKAPISGIRSATGAWGILAAPLSGVVGIWWRAVMGLSHMPYDHGAFEAASTGYLLSSLALFVVSIIVLSTRSPMPVRIAVGASAVQIVLWIIMLVLMGGMHPLFATPPLIWSAVPFGCAVRCVAVERRARGVGYGWPL